MTISLWLKILLLAAVPGLMFCIIPVDGAAFRLSWQLAAIWAGGLAFAALLKSWWLRGFWLMALIVTAMTFPPISEAYVELLTIAVFLAAAEGFRRIDPETAMFSMRIAASVLLVWIFLQESGGLRSWFAPCNAGPFNPNTGGVFLALCLPAFMAGWWWAAVPAIAFGIFITKTTTAMLAVVAGTAVYMLAEAKYAKRPGLSVNPLWGKNTRAPYLAMILILLVLSTAWFVKVDSLSGVMHGDRWTAWKHAAWSMRSEMWGRGLGSWSAVFPLLASGDPRLNNQITTREGKPAMEVFQQAHNEYVQTAFELGAQTLLLILAFLGAAAVAIWRGNLSPQIAAGFAILAVSCFGFFTFHVAPTALLGVAWLGMLKTGLSTPEKGAK